MAGPHTTVKRAKVASLDAVAKCELALSKPEEGVHVAHAMRSIAKARTALDAAGVALYEHARIARARRKR